MMDEAENVVSDEHCNLTCTCTIENISATTGCRVDSKCYKQVNVTLCRNEFRDIVIVLQSVKSSSRINLKYPLKDVAIFKRFLKDGKATIKVNNRLQLLLSNCPSHRLAVFLKCLMIKHSNTKNTPALTSRERLISEKPSSISDISPLNSKDMEHISKNVRSANKENAGVMETPKSKSKHSITKDPSRSKRTLADLTNTPGKSKCSNVSKRCNNNESPGKISGTQLLSKFKSKLQLTAEQRNVVNAVKMGRNVFFTGSAGTGKSFLLRRIIGSLPPDGTVVTASTGAAASMVGGTTLHGFAGIGGGTADIARCYELASRPGVKQGWLRCKVLIIDEISMVSREYFDKLEAVARYVRRRDEPFGGVQLVLCGDFLQLPPVVKGGDGDGTADRIFCFQSKHWSKCVEVSLELTEVKRQTDQEFIDILQSIRMGICTEAMCQRLQDTYHNTCVSDATRTTGIRATKLCTHKDDVDIINTRELAKLPGAVKVFASEDSCTPAQSHRVDAACPAAGTLELKVGAQVMLVKNLRVDLGLVNGARGVVTGFHATSGVPVVSFLCGETLPVGLQRWSVKCGGGTSGHAAVVTRAQIPLRLAWAFSVHRAQGMTLDLVELSLGKVFAPGQAYVALSRARSLRALRLLDFDGACVRAHPHVIAFYSRLFSASHALKTTLPRPLPL